MYWSKRFPIFTPLLLKSCAVTFACGGLGPILRLSSDCSLNVQLLHWLIATVMSQDSSDITDFSNFRYHVENCSEIAGSTSPGNHVVSKTRSTQEEFLRISQKCFEFFINARYFTNLKELWNLLGALHRRVSSIIFYRFQEITRMQ